VSRARPLARNPVTALLSLGLLPAAGYAAEPCYRLDTSVFEVLQGCQQGDAGKLEISASALARLHYDADGLAALLVGKQHYYLRADGRRLAVITYDNGPDYFEQGLTRARVDGQIGYYNTQLQPAFAARFDWGWPFQDGVAEVCQGCRPGKPDADGHTSIVGGTHYRIDRQGNRLPTPTP